MKKILLILPLLLACSSKKEIGKDMLDARLCTHSRDLVPIIQQAEENWNVASIHYTDLSFVGPDEGCDVLVRWADIPNDEPGENCVRIDYDNAEFIEFDPDACIDRRELAMTNAIGHLFMGTYISKFDEDVMYPYLSHQKITDNDLNHLP